MNTANHVRRVTLFRYSVVLPVLWFAVGTLMSYVVPDRRLGIGGTAIILVANATIIAWLFVRQNQRELIKSEIWTLIVFSAIWVVALELIGMLSVLAYPEDFGIEPDVVRSTAFLIGGSIGLLVDFLFVFISFNVTANRFIRWYQKRGGTDAT